MSENTTVHLQGCLDRWRGGDAAARRELLNAACERLTRLTRKMFRADGRLRRWEETGDVCQNALLRLCRALEEVTPASLREFFRLAAVQVRRELIDLARHHYGPAGPAAHHQSVGPGADGESASPGGADAGDSSLEPDKLALWGEFHERAGALPPEEREVFELVYYQGLTHAEAAKLLEVSAKTVQRRWQAACLKLHEALGGQLPGL
jgi:RNA polymerase sigma-70 factor (ECF subfamily)